MSDLNNIMVDIETLSTRSNAIIVSIAAVKFSFTSEDTEQIEININPKVSKELGLHASKETMDWWRTQSTEAVEAWSKSDKDIYTGLDEFVAFTGSDKNTHWFCQGTSFDFPILESSLYATDKPIPWKYWNVHDCRTLLWGAQFDSRNAPRVGVYHVGIDDCLTQINWMKTAMGCYNT